MRVYAEAPTAELAAELAETVIGAVKAELK
jgi:phosphomannomutase